MIKNKLVKSHFDFDWTFECNSDGVDPLNPHRVAVDGSRRFRYV